MTDEKSIPDLLSALVSGAADEESAPDAGKPDEQSSILKPAAKKKPAAKTGNNL